MQQFEDAKFDIVIDKACMDVLVCYGSGDQSKEKNISRMLSEIHRVLTPTGTYFCISQQKEAQRKQYLKNVDEYNWTIEKKAILKPLIGVRKPDYKDYKPTGDDDRDKKYCNFVYICQKKEKRVKDSEAEDSESPEEKSGYEDDQFENDNGDEEENTEEQKIQ